MGRIDVRVAARAGTQGVLVSFLFLRPPCERRKKSDFFLYLSGTEFKVYFEPWIHWREESNAFGWHVSSERLNFMFGTEQIKSVGLTFVGVAQRS